MLVGATLSKNCSIFRNWRKQKLLIGTLNGVQFRWTGTEYVVDEDIVDEFPKEVKRQIVVVNSREVKRRRVKHAIINGAGILEGNQDRTDGRLWPVAEPCMSSAPLVLWSPVRPALPAQSSTRQEPESAPTQPTRPALPTQPQASLSIS